MGIEAGERRSAVLGNRIPNHRALRFAKPLSGIRSSCSRPQSGSRRRTRPGARQFKYSSWANGNVARGVWTANAGACGGLACTHMFIVPSALRLLFSQQMRRRPTIGRASDGGFASRKKRQRVRCKSPECSETGDAHDGPSAEGPKTVRRRHAQRLLACAAANRGPCISHIHSPSATLRRRACRILYAAALYLWEV